MQTGRLSLQQFVALTATNHAKLYGLRHAFGLGRSGRSKVLPFLLIISVLTIEDCFHAFDLMQTLTAGGPEVDVRATGSVDALPAAVRTAMGGGGSTYTTTSSSSW